MNPPPAGHQAGRDRLGSSATPTSLGSMQTCTTRLAVIRFDRRRRGGYRSGRGPWASPTGPGGGGGRTRRRRACRRLSGRRHPKMPPMPEFPVLPAVVVVTGACPSIGADALDRLLVERLGLDAVVLGLGQELLVGGAGVEALVRRRALEPVGLRQQFGHVGVGRGQARSSPSRRR